MFLGVGTMVWADDTPTPIETPTDVPEIVDTDTPVPFGTYTATPTITITFTATATKTITATATITLTPTATPNYYYIYLLNAKNEMNMWYATPNYKVFKRIINGNRHVIIQFVDPETGTKDAYDALSLMQPQELILLDRPPACYQSEYWKRLFE